MKVDYKQLIEVNNYIKGLGLQGKITFRGEVSHLVRAGRNQISLNISEESSRYFITLQKNKKMIKGEWVLKSKSTEELKSVVNELHNNLLDSPDIDHLNNLEKIAEGDFHDDHKDMEMLNMDTSIMVDVYKRAVEEFAHLGCEVSGAFSLGTYTYALINTLVDKPISHTGSDFNFDVVVQLKKHENKEIKAQAVGSKLSEIKTEKIVEELKHHYNLKTTTKRESLELGKYDIVFGPEAVAELLAYTSWIGFSGESYLMQTGMFKKGTHDIGKKVFGENITIKDSPNSENVLFKRRIGLNGVLRKPSIIVDKGVLKELYYSSKEICDRYDVQVNNDMSVASFELETGKGPKDWNELLTSLKKPTIYINTLHYMNFTNVAKGEFTATSRFGTYLIDANKILHHLYNIRVNDSFLRLFNSVKWLSQTLTHINLASTYGMRLSSSITIPQWILVEDVPITACFAPEK